MPVLRGKDLASPADVEIQERVGCEAGSEAKSNDAAR